jgi:DNA-binding XRE family transcriptional regulator
MSEMNKWKKQYKPSRAELAEWMQRSRKIAGLTQIEMANAIGMSIDELNGYEKGNTIADDAATKLIIGKISWQLFYAYHDE